MPRHLFVYGTLRSSFTNRYARLLSARATLKGAARVAGRLYDLGEYPGMVPGAADEWVQGELYELRDAAILSELDSYEGAEFRRVVRIAVTASGDEVPAWVYEFTGQ